MSRAEPQGLGSLGDARPDAYSSALALLEQYADAISLGTWNRRCSRGRSRTAGFETHEEPREWRVVSGRLGQVEWFERSCDFQINEFWRATRASHENNDSSVVAGSIWELGSSPIVFKPQLALLAITFWTLLGQGAVSRSIAASRMKAGRRKTGMIFCRLTDGTRKCLKACFCWL